MRAPAPLAPHRTCANCSTTLRTKLPTMSRVRAPQGEGRAAASAARMLSQLLSVASAFCHGHLLGVGQHGEMCARHTQLTWAAGSTASPHTPPRGCKQPTHQESLGTQRLRRRCAMPQSRMQRSDEWPASRTSHLGSSACAAARRATPSWNSRMRWLTSWCAACSQGSQRRPLSRTAPRVTECEKL